MSKSLLVSLNSTSLRVKLADFHGLTLNNYKPQRKNTKVCDFKEQNEHISEFSGKLTMREVHF